MTHLDPNANRLVLAAWIAVVAGSALFWAVCVAGTWLART